MMNSMTNRVEETDQYMDPINRAEVLGLIASNPQTSSAILDELAEAAGRSQVIPGVLEKIAENPNADLNLLEKLANNPSAVVRAAVANNPRSVPLMWKLACDSNALVRYKVAKNKHFPDHVYQSLALDAEPKVAERAKKTLAKLAKSEGIWSSFSSFVDRIGPMKKAS
jgi:hypothetical protein